jgi:hypothetical protein
MIVDVRPSSVKSTHFQLARTAWSARSGTQQKTIHTNDSWRIEILQHLMEARDLKQKYIVHL